MATNLWSGQWNGRTPVGDVHHRARQVISPSGGIMRGKFPSRKNGRVVHHEGLLELDALYLLEASPRVVRYREQPTTICYPDGGRVRRYTPDLEVTLQSGARIWVEVKPAAFLAREDIRHKLQSVAEHLRRSDQAFIVLTDEVLRQEPRQTNVRTICHQAIRARQTGAIAQSALHWCMTDFPSSLARATKVLAAHGADPYSLLMAGQLRCRLDVPLSPETLLIQTTEADDGWFWLAQEHGF